MGLDRYGATRIRFTWRERRVNNNGFCKSPKVLVASKDQRGKGGKCAYYSTCAVLEAHQRLKTDQYCGDLSWEDLEKKERVLKERGDIAERMPRCFAVLKSEGVRYNNSEETLKIKEFEIIDLKNPNQVANGVKKYLKVGPMLGVFEVVGEGFYNYSESNNMDEFLITKRTGGMHGWTHSVAITGFGVQSYCPFWEFQNTYGPSWRGAARGFGQIYALHLLSLFGIVIQ